MLKEKCLRCGNCLYYCPVYNIKHKETFSPRGRISLIELLEKRNDLPLLRKIFLQECLLCGNCEKNCKASLDLVDEYIKNRVRYKKDSPKMKKLALKFLNDSFLKIYEKLSWFFEHIPVKKLPNYNIDFSFEEGDSQERVVLFPGCVGKSIIPEIKDAARYVLNKLGYKVIIPEFECCGFPFLSAGDKKNFEILKKKNNKFLENLDNLPVITVCSTGYHTLKKYYEKDNVYEFTQFVDNNKKLEKILNGKTLEEKVSVHLPCHYLNFCDGIDSMENILYKIKDLDVYIPERQLCCGFGGMFSLSYTKDSKKILSKSVENLKKNGNRLIVTNCPGCIIQLNQQSKTTHISIFLAKFIKRLYSKRKDKSK